MTNLYVEEASIKVGQSWMELVLGGLDHNQTEAKSQPNYWINILGFGYWIHEPHL